MFRLSPKARARKTLLLSFLVSAGMLFALVYGYDLPRDSIKAHLLQLVGVVGFFILLSLIPAAMLAALRRARRRHDPFRLDRRDDEQ